jgi:hypothetical protein
VLSREASNTNFIVFDLIRLGLEPTIYRIRGKQLTIAPSMQFYIFCVLSVLQVLVLLILKYVYILLIGQCTSNTEYFEFFSLTSLIYLRQHQYFKDWVRVQILCIGSWSSFYILGPGLFHYPDFINTSKLHQRKYLAFFYLNSVLKSLEMFPWYMFYCLYLSYNVGTYTQVTADVFTSGFILIPNVL